MATTTIAIIGATGEMGSAIARSLARGPYRLLLFAHDKEKLENLKSDIVHDLPLADIDCVGCPMDASWEADIIIPAVPYVAEKEVAEKIREVATQKIVVSIANPLNETYSNLVTLPTTSAAEELQRSLPSSKVVKAFNTGYAANFSQPVIDGQRADAFIAGNDEEALSLVRDLVTTAGFQPVMAGSLPVSRLLESMQLLLIQLTQKNGYKGAAGFKILHS